MYRYSFIQNINKNGLLRLNFFKVIISSLDIKLIISIIVLLVSCAPSTQDNSSELLYPNTLNGCVQKVIDHETFIHKSFESCVKNTNQELTDTIRADITDYVISASNSELQNAATIIVSKRLAKNQDYTKEEFARLILKEIEDILSQNEDRI